MKTILLPLMMPWFHWFEFGVISKQLGTWNFWERKSVYSTGDQAWWFPSFWIDFSVYWAIHWDTESNTSIINCNSIFTPWKSESFGERFAGSLERTTQATKDFWNVLKFWILDFFYLLFGCPTANFGALLRGQLYALNFNHCILSNFDRKVTMSLVTRQGL